MVDGEDERIAGGDEAPRRKTYSPPDESAVFTGSFPIIDGDDTVPPLSAPTPPAPTSAIAAPVRASLSDAEILRRFQGERSGSTADMMNELERHVNLRQEEEEAFTMWANLTRATRGPAAETIIARERFIFDGGDPDAFANPEATPEIEPVVETTSSVEEESSAGEALRNLIVEPETVDATRDSVVGDPDDGHSPAMENDVSLPIEGELDTVTAATESDAGLPELVEDGDDEKWPLPQADNGGSDGEVLNEKAFVVDYVGLEPTGENQKTLSTVGLFWMWFASLTPVIGIIGGAYFVSRGLGFLETVVATSVGGLVAGALLAGVAAFGRRTGVPTLHSAKETFGVWGNLVPSVLILVIRLAVAVTLVVLGQELVTRTLTLAGLWPWDLWILRLAVGVVLMALVMVLAILGGRVLRVALWATAGLGVAGVAGFVALTASSLTIGSVGGWSTGVLPMVAAGSLVLSGFLVLWGHSGGDFARFHSGSSRVAVPVISGVVAVVPTIVFIAYAAWVSVQSPLLSLTLVTDPAGTLAGLLPGWYPAPIIIGLALPLVGLASVSVFSGGLGLMALGGTVSRPAAGAVFSVLVLTGVAAVIALEHNIAAYFPDVLLTAGVVMAAWAGSYVIDMVARRSDSSIPAVRVAPLLGMLVSLGLGWGLTTSSVSWLAWQGYLFPLLDLVPLIDLSPAQPGVLVALLFSGAVALLAAIPSMKKPAAGIDA